MRISFVMIYVAASAAMTALCAAACGGGTNQEGDGAVDGIADEPGDAELHVDIAADTDGGEDAGAGDVPAEELVTDAAEDGIDEIPADPGESGPHSWLESVEEGVEVEEGMLPQTVDLTLFIPDGDGPFPVIVFTHGFMLGPGDYMSYGRHLASWGYLSVLPQMPGGLMPPSHRELKEYLLRILDWIDENASNPEGPLMGRADASRLGLSGHSMGGKISLYSSTTVPSTWPTSPGAPWPTTRPPDWSSTTRRTDSRMDSRTFPPSTGDAYARSMSMSSAPSRPL